MSFSPVDHRNILVLGASTGGIEALKELLSQLPADFPGSLFVVQHTGAAGPNLLNRILGRQSKLPVANASDGERFLPGRVYVAPADWHLILEPGERMRLSHGPRENRFRPSIDALFRSAAANYGARVIGVILTGFLDDGTSGLWAVKDRGGLAVVQNPEDAMAPSMPMSAIRHVQVDHCVSLEKLGPLLTRLVSEQAPRQEPSPLSATMENEVRIAAEDAALEHGVMAMGKPSVFACPECHGVLLQLEEGSSVRFRCHTGHAYTMESLLADFEEKTEETLWNALRAVEEKILLIRNMARALGDHDHGAEAAALLRQAEDTQDRANLVRRALMWQKEPRTRLAS